jgi:hypothetical protein
MQIEHLYRSPKCYLCFTEILWNTTKIDLKIFFDDFEDDKLVALCLQTEVEMPFFRIKGLLMGIGVFS